MTFYFSGLAWPTSIHGPLSLWPFKICIWVPLICTVETTWSNWLLLVNKSKWFFWPAGKTFLIREFSHYPIIWNTPFQTPLSHQFVDVDWHYWYNLSLATTLSSVICIFFLHFVKSSYLRVIPHKCCDRIIICYWSEWDNENHLTWLCSSAVKHRDNAWLSFENRNTSFFNTHCIRLLFVTPWPCCYDRSRHW